MTTYAPEDSGEKLEKPVLPTRIIGPLESEVEAIADREYDKLHVYEYDHYRKDAIEDVGRERYNAEVANSHIDQALLYINMTREQVEATGHQPGVLPVMVEIGKTPAEIREYLSRPPELPAQKDPKVVHMELAQRALEKPTQLSTMRPELAMRERIRKPISQE